MNKEQWKQVFSAITDEDLVILVEVWQLNVKGFRSVTKDKMKVARSRIILEALKPKKLRQIIEFYNLSIENGDEEKADFIDVDVREKSVNELLLAYEKGKDLHWLLGGLFSSEDSEHHTTAGEFIAELLQKEGANSIEELVGKDKKVEADPEEQSNDGEFKNLEKKFAKLEVKNQKLQEQVGDWEQKYSALKQEIKSNKQQWAKEKAQMQQKVSTEKSHIENMEQKTHRFEEEKKQFQMEIKELKAKIADLHAKMLQAPKQVVASEVNKPTDKRESTYKIIMIGDPKNKMIDQSENPLFHVIDPRNQDVFEEINSLEFKEMWMLNYLVPVPMRKKLMHQFSDRARGFQNFNEVKTYLMKGRR